jgi:hypothetical protein
MLRRSAEELEGDAHVRDSPEFPFGCRVAVPTLVGYETHEIR